MEEKRTRTRRDDVRKLIPFNRFELETMLNRSQSARDRALFCCLYLTGARINEVLSLTRDQFKEEENHGKQFLVIYNVLTLKRRDNKVRRIDILISKEKLFIDPLFAWLNLINDGDRLFDIKRARAWQIIRTFGTFPHFLRHTRSTHLIQDYKFNAYELKEYHAWKRLVTGENYVSLYGDFLSKKMAEA